MSRGHTRLQRAVLAAVESSPMYGCTFQDLVWRCYPGQECSDAHVDAVRRAVRRLIVEGRLIEQAGYFGRRISSAPARKPRVRRTPAPDGRPSGGWLRCVSCDVQWRRDGGTACWSCGRRGEPGSSPATEPFSSA